MSSVILFSGQGLQQHHHVDELIGYCDQYPIEDALLALIPEVFKAKNLSLDLYQNDFAQPFIFALQWCRWQFLKDSMPDLEISHVAGYSLGELSAVICSTQTDFNQGLALAKTRAELMSHVTAHHSGLTSIQGMNVESLKPLMEQTNTYLSIKLNDSSFIVGGFNQDLGDLECLVQNQGCQIKRLQVTIPSHTPLMQMATLPYKDYIQTHVKNNLDMPILSGTKGYHLYQTKAALEALVYQMDHMIDWDLSHEAIIESMPDVILELGPGNALTRMLNLKNHNTQARAWDDFKGVEGLMQWFTRI